MLKFIENKEKSSKENMLFDKELLEKLDENSPCILHFYEWKKPSITYGYFIEKEKYLDIEKIKEMGIDLARRPTGGGIVFHMWDMAFSFLMPCSCAAFSENCMKNYSFVNNCVIKAVREFSKEKEFSFHEKQEDQRKDFQKFCMSHSTHYDVVVGKKKIAGAAQRKKKTGFLHQGTISLCMPEKNILEKILKNKEVATAIIKATSPLLLDKKKSSVNKAKKCLRHLLKKYFSRALFLHKTISESQPF